MHRKKQLPDLQKDTVFGEFTSFRSFKKGEVILQEGRVENYVSYVCKGIVGMFLTKEAEEICYGFVFENGYLSAYDSFLQRTPAQFSVLALENVLLASISYDNLQLVLNSSIEGQAFGRQIAEKLYIKSQQRIIAFLTQSAEERYLDLMKERPEVFKRVKQKYIASYLGITPVSLSRIRAKITLKA
jgi:CRP-like cAMP-binding protein